MALWYCRVCGLDYDYSPWGPNDDEPDYSICECCGAQFGIDDYTVSGAQAYRRQWLSTGSSWFYPKLQPADWQLEEQLAYVPEKYR
ncbi:hypothetical protein [Hymenobacter metallicola]|uniref:Rubredoxin-like domain-containing protein n=1 Tax=Hymenobacter metallicola TaxID=2563114 RepID=A0A4Z0QH53_9BACT|nr:hypothetical protein [Hymenobacter metallicola]TGE28012.1 hypothetical protein E5K02_00675 [Hymenobacter metallicola]